MKRITAFVIATLIALTLTMPVAADGIIIIDPPPEPPPDWMPWLTIRYHRVHVTIDGQIATTRVDQVFRNDGPNAAEGTYIFPLPPGAVVQQFTMWVDGKPLDAQILEADEARDIYESYVRRRRDPALLEYVGRDAVQARIFPIPPGEERRIEIEYTQILPLEEGLMHYRYPLDTERFSAQPLEEVSIVVEINANQPLRALYSSTHQDELMIERNGDRRATLSYEATNIYPSRDFELYAGFGDQEIGAKLLTHQPIAEDGFFLLMLSPSIEVDRERIVPRDIFLVLDTSGSMEGNKLFQAKEALNYVLRHLNPEDRFNVISFSSNVRTYASELCTSAEAAKAINWVQKLEALGGTNIYLALTEMIQQTDPERPSIVLFLTDGIPTEGITEEDVLLSTLQTEAPDAARIFPFGVGYDVNTLLLDQLAENHKGRPSYVKPDERIDEQISVFYERVQRPLLTDIELDFSGVSTYDIYPQPLPDLYAGTQLLVTGRYTGDGYKTLRLTGSVAGQRTTYVYKVDFQADSGTDFIPRLWAARRIGHLLTQIRLHGEQQEWIDAVVTLSLRYGIITPYTSFLVQEEDVLTSAQREKAADTFRAVPTPSASGQAAVEEAEQRLGLGGAEAPPSVDEAVPERTETDHARHIRYVEDKTFLCDQESCTDSSYVPDKMTALEIKFGSERYWQLLSDHTSWSEYLALASEVTFVAPDGTAYHISPDEGREAPLETPADPATPPTSTPATDPSKTPTALPSRIPGLCAGSLALILFGVLMSWYVIQR